MYFLRRKMNPKELIKNKIIYETERKLQAEFFEKGRHYLVDENAIHSLYKVFNNRIESTMINTYEDKLEIKKAYPHFFIFEQVGFSYKITKKNSI
jgi:hypothetical protein